ncbi:MAG: CoA transferase, partial [Polyangiales bacterium]
ALLLRTRTGLGQHLDISMLESMLATDDYVHLALDGVRENDGVVVNEVWDVVGGPIVIAGDFRWVWQRMHATHGLVDGTPAGAPVAEKAKHRHAAIAAFFAGFSQRADLLSALEKADLAYGEIKDTATALRARSVQARGVVVEIDDRGGGTRKVVQSPYRFSDAQSGVAGPAPRRGEHNAEVLREWLALGEGEIEALASNGTMLKEN